MAETKRQKNEHTFSQEVKEEIASNLIHANKQEVVAFLSGFFKQTGSLIFAGGQMGLDVQTANAAVARKIYQSIKRHFPSLRIEIVVRRMVKLKKQNIYVLRIFDASKQLFKLTHFFDDADGFAQGVPELYRAGNYLHFFLQGIFLGSGSINNLQKTNYHLELVFSEEQYARDIIKCLEPYRIYFKFVMRRKASVLYLKDSTMIGDFLAFLRANNARFHFEDIRISRDMTNSMNRLMNCEIANEQKAMKASEIQIQNILQLEERLGVDYFNDREQIIIEARKTYPEISLAELSDVLLQQYRLQISKSGLNHIFRKFSGQVERLNTRDDV